MNNLFYSLISFIIAIFFIMLGVVGVMIPWSPDIRTDIVQFILDDSLAISLFGFAFIVIGLAIVTHILINSKQRYYHIRSDNNSVAIDEAIIQDYLDIYWKQIFPNCDIPSRLSLKNNKIHIAVEFPHLPVSQQHPLLERIKHDLRSTFAKLLGYHNEFYLSVSFQAESKKNTP